MSEIKLSKKDFKEVISAMVDGFDKEHLETPMFRHMIKNKKYLEDASDIQTMIVHPFNRCLELAISISQKIKRESVQLWMDYDFLENNVSQLCSTLYGSGCSVDRGSFIVKSYIKFKNDGIMPKLNWKKEYTFHYPETGTMKQWFAFVAGVHHLKYGYNKSYLLALKSLMGLKKAKVSPSQKTDERE